MNGRINCSYSASKKKLGDFHCTEPDCDYYTTRNDKLKMHIKTKHEGLRFVSTVINFGKCSLFDNIERFFEIATRLYMPAI